MTLRQRIEEIIDIPFRIDYGWPLTQVRRKKQVDELVKLFEEYKKNEIH